ncbi:hypothetical protein ACW2AE_00755 [Limosilactobacillus fermentum]
MTAIGMDEVDSRTGVAANGLALNYSQLRLRFTDRPTQAHRVFNLGHLHPHAWRRRRHEGVARGRVTTAQNH